MTDPVTEWDMWIGHPDVPAIRFFLSFVDIAPKPGLSIFHVKRIVMCFGSCVLFMLRLHHRSVPSTTWRQPRQGLPGRNCQIFQVKTLQNELRTVRRG